MSREQMLTELRKKMETLRRARDDAETASRAAAALAHTAQWEFSQAEVAYYKAAAAPRMPLMSGGES